MANNITVHDANLFDRVMKTTDTASVHTPHSNVDTMPTGASAAEVQGTVAHDAADGQKPVKIGGWASDTEPAKVTASDRVNGWFDLQGRPVVIAGHPSPEQPKVITLTATTETDMCTAASGGKICVVTRVTLSSTAPAMRYVSLREKASGDGGAVRIILAVASDAGGAVWEGRWKCATADSPTAQLDAAPASGAVYVNVNYSYENA